MLSIYTTVVFITHHLMHTTYTKIMISMQKWFMCWFYALRECAIPFKYNYNTKHSIECERITTIKPMHVCFNKEYPWLMLENIWSRVQQWVLNGTDSGWFYIEARVVIGSSDLEKKNYYYYYYINFKSFMIFFTFKKYCEHHKIF